MTAPTTSRPGSAPQPLRPKRRQLPFPLNLYQTAVGKKWVMAITGIMLLGFVLVHMIGNLKFYLGAIEHNGVLAYDIDIYSEFLRELLVPLLPRTVTLWLLRIGLIAAFVFHIHAAYALTRMNLASNRRYADKRDWLAANFASRSMRYTGVIFALYLVFHLADLTWGWIPGYDWERGHVYQNLVGSMSNPVVAIVYVIANVALAVHLFHGIYSMFQSLGINNPAYNALRRRLATVLSLLILIGNVSFPIAIVTGIVDLDPNVVSAESE